MERSEEMEVGDKAKWGSMGIVTLGAFYTAVELENYVRSGTHWIVTTSIGKIFLARADCLRPLECEHDWNYHESWHHRSCLKCSLEQRTLWEDVVDSEPGS
jgi:hypothetical protein